MPIGYGLEKPTITFYEANDVKAIKDTEQESAATKVLEKGRLQIVRNGMKFTIDGVQKH